MALEVVGIELEEGLHRAWRGRIERVAQLLGWPVPRFADRRDGCVVTLTFTAPCNQLHTAREANEWALCAALLERDPSHWGSLQESLRAAVTAAAAGDPQRTCVATEIEEAPALQRLQRIGAAEARAGSAD